MCWNWKQKEKKKTRDTVTFERVSPTIQCFKVTLTCLSLPTHTCSNTYSRNLEVVASWSRLGSSAPGAESPQWPPPSGAPGSRSASAAWSRRMRKQGGGRPEPTGGTWDSGTCRWWKPVPGAVDSAAPVWESSPPAGVWPAGTECPPGGTTPGCSPDCRRSGPATVHGPSCPRAVRQFGSFSISPFVSLHCTSLADERNVAGEKKQEEEEKQNNKTTWSFDGAQLLCIKSAALGAQWVSRAHAWVLCFPTKKQME